MYTLTAIQVLRVTHYIHTDQLGGTSSLSATQRVAEERTRSEGAYKADLAKQNSSLLVCRRMAHNNSVYAQYSGSTHIPSCRQTLSWQPAERGRSRKLSYDDGGSLSSPSVYGMKSSLTCYRIE